MPRLVGKIMKSKNKKWKIYITDISWPNDFWHILHRYSIVVNSDFILKYVIIQLKFIEDYIACWYVLTIAL